MPLCGPQSHPLCNRLQNWVPFCLLADIRVEPGVLSRGQLLPFPPGPGAQLFNIQFPRGSFC